MAEGFGADAAQSTAVTVKDTPQEDTRHAPYDEDVAARSANASPKTHYEAVSGVHKRIAGHLSLTATGVNRSSKMSSHLYEAAKAHKAASKLLEAHGERVKAASEGKSEYPAAQRSHALSEVSKLHSVAAHALDAHHAASGTERLAGLHDAVRAANTEGQASLARFTQRHAPGKPQKELQVRVSPTKVDTYDAKKVLNKISEKKGLTRAGTKDPETRQSVWTREERSTMRSLEGKLLTGTPREKMPSGVVKTVRKPIANPEQGVGIGAGGMAQTPVPKHHSQHKPNKETPTVKDYEADNMPSKQPARGRTSHFQTGAGGTK